MIDKKIIYDYLKKYNLMKLLDGEIKEQVEDSHIVIEYENMTYIIIIERQNGKYFISHQEI